MVNHPSVIIIIIMVVFGKGEADVRGGKYSASAASRWRWCSGRVSTAVRVDKRLSHVCVRRSTAAFARIITSPNCASLRRTCRRERRHRVHKLNRIDLSSKIVLVATTQTDVCKFYPCCLPLVPEPNRIWSTFSARGHKCVIVKQRSVNRIP